MIPSERLDEAALAALAKKLRAAAGRNRTEAARELRVSRPAIFYAEEEPQRSLSQLRKRIVEQYSDLAVVGPIYLLKRKSEPKT